MLCLREWKVVLLFCCPETIDALADAINHFSGGVVLVSHDMRLISQVAKEVWECKDRAITKFDGDIIAYKEKLKAEIARQVRGPTFDSWHLLPSVSGRSPVLPCCVSRRNRSKQPLRRNDENVAFESRSEVK